MCKFFENKNGAAILSPAVFQFCRLVGRRRTTLSWLSQPSCSSTGQTLVGASSKLPSCPIGSTPVCHGIPSPPGTLSSGQPLLTGRQRMAQPTKNTSRGTSQHKGLVVASCQPLLADPDHSTPAATVAQPLKRTKLL